MAGDSLNELYNWARSQLNTTVMLRYVLLKVNGQTPDKVSILLRDMTSLKANAEIEVEYHANLDYPYQAVFSLLPFNMTYPRPVQLRPTFKTQQEVIYWIRTGQKRLE